MVGPGAAVASETRCLAKPFVIARGAMTHVELVTVRLWQDGYEGQGECCPVAHFGETVAGVMAEARALCDRLAAGESWEEVHAQSVAGAARNAVDCAVWDWRAKRASTPAWQLAGCDRPALVPTLYTISMDTPDRMAAAARAAGRGYPVLKIKLGGTDDMARVRAIRAAVPDGRLVADVNEGWTRSELIANLPVLEACGFEMIEQPLPAGQDEDLAGIKRRILISADESCHTTRDLARIAPFYDLVNIKLDKTGGLTEALSLRKAAQDMGLQAMVGCMLGTSLAMAPALLVAQKCRYADLDGPLMIGSDRDHGLIYDQGLIQPAPVALWG